MVLPVRVHKGGFCLQACWHILSQIKPGTKRKYLSLIQLRRQEAHMNFQIFLQALVHVSLEEVSHGF